MNGAIRLACALVLAAVTFSASARDLSKDEIVCALDPSCAKGRGREPARGITATGGVTEAAPAVDLYVNFAYDSVELTGEARTTLDRLGSALRDARLDAYAFMIAGHTDAKGDAGYNQKLSERRADAVRRYLIDQHKIATSRLSSIGYGSTQLLDPSRPEDGVNRRVRVVNVSASGSRLAASSPVDDPAACAKASGEEAVAACSRRISTGELGGHDLAVAYRNRAWALQSKGDLDRAIVDYNDALRFDPKYAQALANRGVAWRLKREYDRAIPDLDEAIRLSPNYAYAYFQRAYVWHDKGDYDRSISDYNEAIRLNPKDSGAFNNRGNAWRDKGDRDRAMADYDEALRLDPKNAFALANRGRSWRDKGDLVRALADLDEAVRLQPNNTYALLQRAYSLQVRHDYDRAIADYDNAIRINPKDASAFNSRGTLLREKGEWDRAIADFDEALRLDAKYATALANRGRAWRDKGDRSRALADLDEAVKLQPSNAYALFQRAYTFAEKGDHDHAIADYSESIRINPKDAVAFNNRGNSWRGKGNLDRAIADFDEAIRLDPRLALAYTNRGSAWRAKPNLDRALADLSEAIRLDRDYASPYTHRGLVYESKGQLSQARGDFSAALAASSKSIGAKWAQDTARARLALLPPQTATAEKQAAPSAGQPAPSGERIALVIGNGAYVNAPKLPNPANDARAMADALRGIGFTVFSGTDLDRTKMELTIRDFLRKTLSARIALLFYAGHGVQIDGKNYLVPIDAKEINRTTVGFELVDLDRILAGLDDEARANVVLLDACRDNPLEARSASGRSAARGSGLAGYSSVNAGTLIGFATAPGKTAADGVGTHSPFTAALLKHLTTPKLEINQMLTRVRVDVVEATNREQVPWANSSLLGEIYLNDGLTARASGSR